MKDGRHRFDLRTTDARRESAGRPLDHQHETAQEAHGGGDGALPPRELAGGERFPFRRGGPPSRKSGEDPRRGRRAVDPGPRGGDPRSGRLRGPPGGDRGGGVRASAHRREVHHARPARHRVARDGREADVPKDAEDPPGAPGHGLDGARHRRAGFRDSGAGRGGFPRDSYRRGIR